MNGPSSRPAGSAAIRTPMAFALAFLLAQVSGAPRAEAGGPHKAAQIRQTTFASGLNFPYGMLHVPDGSLLVATSNPTGGSYFASTGVLVRLVDADGDGHADGPPQPVF